MHTLSIDLETYSEAPIADTGAYKYIHDPSFEILLFAYSLDGNPVEVVDLAQGEVIPDWVINALSDSAYIKRAYNANFEWNCLTHWTGKDLPINQWRCTMIHGMYAGYTLGLDATGVALGLPAEKQKLKTGKELIKYFCIPCKATKANGGRKRNLPHHDPEKWELFKEYNRQDVVTEMEIERRLSSTPVPDQVQKQWETDMIINARGVAVDMDMVNGALDIGEKIKEGLVKEATQLTGLSNPNSIQQLSGWIQRRTGIVVEDLTKDTVAKMIESTKDLTVKRVLQIRQELGKTSTKKYDAIKAAVCDDGRVRGLLQFYGSHTGRWAGRLVQVQNLPRTYLDHLDLAREMTVTRNIGGLEFIYGPSINDTLSQLIRTAFVPSKGHILIDADFAQIEARVISWMAGQQWRLDVFKSGADIYCASASQMFGVPVEKHGANSHLRSKGKIAELALGYQGSSGALINMGALDMGLSEDELPEIVERWRDANDRIVSLWYAIQNAAIQVIVNGGAVKVGCVTFEREYGRTFDQSAMSIQLPSGRKLYYIMPQVGENRWGGPSITFMGVDQNTKQWTRSETYGGKLTENIIQAIARDCLALCIEKLEAAGFPIVFHVHDEVCIDVDPAKFATSGDQALLDQVIGIMSEPIAWAPGLPLSADGWTGMYFKKD